MSVSFQRQAGILDPEIANETHITVCGLGTVGSNAAIELARLGIGSLTLIDGDKVEEHNLPSQAFNLSDVGSYKTEALQQRVTEVSNANVEIQTEMLEGGEMFDPGPVIMAVDNMDIRKAVLEDSVADVLDHPIYIDGRMGAKMWQLLALNPSEPDQVSRWVNGHYFPQDQAAPLPCGGRTVSFIGGFMGGLIASYICRTLNEEEVPFFLTGDLDSFSMNRIN